MGKITSWLIFYCCVIYFKLCNGYSINLEDTVPDQHTQLLTAIIGILLTVCSLVFIIGCLCCHRRNDFKVFQNSPVVECVTSESQDPGYINPVNGEFTIFTPLSPTHYNNNGCLQQTFTRNLNNSCASEKLPDITTWLNDTGKDFPRLNLKYVEELGRGKYGKVVEGAAQFLDNNGEVWTPVIIRILDTSSTDEERHKFLEEALIYKHGGHPNILSLIGRCFDSIPLLIIQEYCQGDLKSYLSRMCTESSTIDYTLLWCSQLCSALKFLHEHQIIHPDIASRNCQLNSSKNLKLGDYGLGMYKYPEDYHQNIPIRWCDPECLVFENNTLKIKKLSFHNNIWSLGVTFWEICEGSQPYLHLTNEDILQLLKLKNNLSKPSRNTAWMNKMYQIMQTCWSDIEVRPCIIEIDILLSNLLEMYPNSMNKKSMISSSDDFDKKWEVLSPNSTLNMDLNSDSVLLGIDEDYDVNSSKLLSPSLNNLHGSLDNLLSKTPFSLDESIENNCDSDSISGSETFLEGKSLNNNCSKDFLKSMSSGSETEEENWREKVVKGTYTEKVRVKSKSITDLMVLTHIDYCESESETPFSSISYKVNSKTPRSLSSKSDFPYLSFGSEGNLLNIQNTIPDKTKVNEELKKFHEVYNYNNCTSECKIFPQNNYGYETENNLKDNANSFYEMNVQPQVFNLYNVTIDNLPHVNNELNDYISYNNLSNHEIVIKETNSHPETTMFSNSQLSNSNDRLCDSSISSSIDNILVAKYESHSRKENCIHVGMENDQDNQMVTYEADLEDFEPTDSNLRLNNKEEDVAVINDESLINSQDNVFKSKLQMVRKNISCKDKSPVVNLKENLEEISDLKISQNESSQSWISSLLYKNIPLKLKFENFSSITLFNITIDPYDKKYGNCLMHWNTFLLETLHIKEELNIECNSGPKSILFFNQIDKVVNNKAALFGYSSSNEINNVWLENSVPDHTENNNFDYSLETWDNFLEKALNEPKEHNDSFCYEQRSIIFPNEDLFNNVSYVESSLSTPCNSVVDEKHDSLDDENIDNVETGYTNVNNTIILNQETSLEKDYEDSETENWEKNEGWYLHPQTKEDLCGEIEIGSCSTDSYVGFGIDDELMSAVRDELIKKLPHAQKIGLGQVEDDNEWESQEREEVFLRYNVYNSPLPPIPEESLYGDESDLDTPVGQGEYESDWSAHCEPPQDTESQSSHTVEVPKHCHTLSESSCCSNDTLFNLEELNSAPNEADKQKEPTNLIDKIYSIKIETHQTYLLSDGKENLPDILNSTFEITSAKSDPIAMLEEYNKRSNSKQSLLKNENINDFLINERKYSNEIFDKYVKTKTPSFIFDERNTKQDYEIESSNIVPSHKINISETEATIEKTNRSDLMREENTSFIDSYDKNDYNNLNIDYRQYVDLENSRNSWEYDGCRNEIDYLNILEKNPNSEEDNIFDMLADIRFSGPTDSQLISTSFSESNTCDEKEWDSGSDSRSSSSGEFIWKEGEREESLKAIRTVHQESEDGTNEDTDNPLVESDISSTFSEEDRETPEFVPSAWDKFAMPIKSALRSPEKTLTKSGIKKPKVWFKKQKYHCIYEYPKEPESPVFQKEVQWHNDLRTFQDWEFDNEPCLTELDDSEESSDYTRRSRSLTNSRNLYQLTDVSDFMSGMNNVDDKFFVSSSSRPFEMDNESSSQFFPGSISWINVENATPDSGVEDIATPSNSIENSGFLKTSQSVPSLKQLSSAVIKKNELISSRCDDHLGGLRHTRNKLKLELPPSPSAFTVGRMFTVDNSNHESLPRETPTFTTFGKSRFLVQHIDTPSECTNRNVSFEALPYKPPLIIVKESHTKNNVIIDKNVPTNSNMNDSVKVGTEAVKGEASLLDSADEDSGIESSTLEKKINT